MAVIQIEQDDPKLLNRLRDKIALASEAIRQSYFKDELRGVNERTLESAMLNGYLIGLYEQQLLSDRLFAELNGEWEAARAAAGADSLAGVGLRG